MPSSAVSGTVDSTVITATSQADKGVYDSVTDRTTVVAALPAGRRRFTCRSC